MILELSPQHGSSPVEVPSEVSIIAAIVYVSSTVSTALQSPTLPVAFEISIKLFDLLSDINDQQAALHSQMILHYLASMNNGKYLYSAGQG